MSDLDSFAFEPGQQVQCKTRFEEAFKGEVVAFDLNTKILILKSPSSSGTTTNHDLHILVLDSVSDVEIIEEPHGESTSDMPTINMKYIEARQASNASERLRLVEAVGNGVSHDGISLYATLSKKLVRATDITWKDKVKIVVLNAVVISPPYKEADCEPLSQKTPKDAVAYVKSNVRHFWESCSKQKSLA